MCNETNRGHNHDRSIRSEAERERKRGWTVVSGRDRGGGRMDGRGVSVVLP